MKRRCRKIMALLLSAGAVSPVWGQAAPAGSVAVSKTPAQWQAITRADIDGYADAVRANHIYAVYPDPVRWLAHLDVIAAEARSKVALVKDAAGYQAVLKYLSVMFHDAHVGIRFALPPSEARWPGFLLRFDNGRYRVTASHIATVADGSEVSACDGEPISAWIDTVATYEGGLPVTLETTRMIAAMRLFVDRGSPLRARPSTCTIGGKAVTLTYTVMPAKEINPIILSWDGRRDPEVSTRLIGTDGAWVKLGYFDPLTAAQADAFHKAIEAAPTLREKRFIVLDVRGNGGGPYNWFMAYLRGLYGQAYADHYATARLRIRAAYRISPVIEAADTSDETAAAGFKEPADPPYERNDKIDEVEKKRAIAAGEKFFRASPLPIERGAAPANPVKAQVFVLTDYGCGSACIGFVDEMKLFPGVQQIGLPTTVDSRTGSAVSVKLPSGFATAFIASMTRDGRVRDDNVPQTHRSAFSATSGTIGRLRRGCCAASSMRSVDAGQR